MMKEGSTNKNNGSIVFPKSRGAQKSLFRVGNPKEREVKLDEWFVIIFSHLLLHLKGFAYQ